MSDSQSSKIESEIQINAKDNASSSINKVTTSIKKLGDQVISVDELITKLSVNVIDAAQSIDRSFGSIDTKKLTEINKAMSLPMEAERSKAKSNLDKAKAKEISTKTKNGYYDAETELMLAKAAHAGDQLAISLNKLQEQIERKKATEFRYLAASKNYDTAYLKKDYWDAQAKFKRSSEFYDQVRSMNAARDARTQRWQDEAQRTRQNKSRSEMAKGLSQIGGAVSSFNDPSGLGKALGGVAQSFGNILAATTKLDLGLKTITETIKLTAKVFNEAISAFQNVEAIKTNLGVISGSDIEGGRLFNNIAEYAIKSPFGIQQTAEQATLLKQSGVYAEDLMDTLKMVGDLAGGNADKMRRISNDYAHIVSNGKANMLQLRQFATAGIPIYKELSKELGVSNETIRKMVKEGEIGADKIEKVLKNLTSEGGAFYQAVEKGAKTLKARTTNLADARTLAFSEIGQGIVNVGRNGDTEGILLKMLSFQEGIFKGVRDIAERSNQDKDLKNLQEKEKKYLKAEERYANAKSSSSDLMYFEQIMAKGDMERYKYDFKDEYAQNVFFNAYKNVSKDIQVIRDQRDELDTYIADVQEQLKNSSGKDMFTIISLQNQLKTLKEAREEMAGRITGEKGNMNPLYAQAASRAYFNNMYSSSTEILEKGSKGEGSLLSITDEMLNKQKQTAEWKEKELEAQKKLFESTKKTAEELSKLLGSDDVLDVSKISSVKDFKKYSQLFTQGDKFEIDPFLYSLGNANDVKRASEVNKQFQDALYNALRIARTTDQDLKEDQAFKDLYNLLSSLTGKDFLNNNDQFNTAYNAYFDLLEETAKGSGVQKEIANIFKSIINPIISGEIIGNTKAKDIDLSFGNEILPLWARILGSGLGLDASMVKNAGGAKTLRLHEQEQYSRNITKSFLSAGAKSYLSPESLIQTLALSNPAKKRADAAGVSEYQLDWNKTKQNIKSFSLQIGQAAEVTSAYRKSVESEIDTLSSLLSDMPTTFEDAKNVKGFDDLFINAFTGRIKLGKEDAYYDASTKLVTTFKGVQYSIDDVKDQISFSEDSIKELTKQLKNRRADLIEAQRAEAKNTTIEESKKSFQDKYFAYIAKSRYGLTEGSAQYTNFLKQAELGIAKRNYEDYQWSDTQNKYISSGKKIDDASRENKKRLNKIFENKKLEELALGEKLSNARGKFASAESQMMYLFGERELGLKNFSTNDVEEKLKDLRIKELFNKFTEENKNREFNGKTYAELSSNVHSAESELRKVRKELTAAYEEYSNAEVTNLEESRKAELMNNAGVKLATSMDVLSKVAEESLGENSSALIALDKNTEKLNEIIKHSDFAKSLNYLENPKASMWGGMQGNGLDFFRNKWFTGKYGFDRKDLSGVGSAFTQEIYKDFMDNADVAESYFNKISGKSKLGTKVRDLIGNRAQAEIELLKMQSGSNANLLSRPNIPVADLIKAGWKDLVDDGSIATVFSSTYSSDDGRVANFTPIKANGSVLSPKDFEEYIDNYFSTGIDSDNLLLGSYNSIEEAVKAGELLHEYQETFYGTEIDQNAFAKMSEDLVLFQSNIIETAKKMDELKTSIASTFESFTSGMVVNVFETIGESLTAVTDASSSWKDLGKNFVKAVDEMTGQIGELMITAGLTELIKGNTALGLTLLGVGGLSSIVSGMLDTENKDDNEEKIKKLENLKADLKDLIAQAKNDAIYYEKNLSHKKALTTSQAISVNDAIITPSGNVISTHPDDYLIATKTPDTLMGGKGNSQPIINVNIKNNTDQKLTVTQTRTESNGEINIEAIIEGVVGKGIAEGQFDGALSARETRLHGSRVYM